MNIHQYTELKEVIDYVYKNKYCDFYRKHYASQGLDKKDIDILKDFERFPLISKGDILKYEEDGKRFCFVRWDQVKGCACTTGSTGQPFVFYHSEEDLRIIDQKNYYANSRYLLNGDRILLFARQNLRHGTDIEQRGYLTVRGDIYNLKVSAILAKKMNINVLIASPVIALKIAELLAIEGYDPKDMRLIYIYGEVFSSSAMIQLKKLYPHAQIVCGCGVSECGGKIGYQCQDIFGRNEYHILSDHYLVEVLDPETKKACTPDETGELVITTLWRGASPFIRYRTGDLVRLIEKNCSCMDKGPIISFVGRSDAGCLRISGVTLFMENIEQALSYVEIYNRGQYQLHIYEKNIRGKVLPYFAIHMVPSNNIPLTHETEEKIADIIMDNLKITSEYNWRRGIEKNIFAPIQVKFVTSIDLDEGLKLKKIIDHRSDDCSDKI